MQGILVHSKLVLIHNRVNIFDEIDVLHFNLLIFVDYFLLPFFLPRTDNWFEINRSLYFCISEKSGNINSAFSFSFFIFFKLEKLLFRRNICLMWKKQVSRMIWGKIDLTAVVMDCAASAIRCVGWIVTFSAIYSKANW